MSIQEKYNAEFATFYKEKLSATVEGKPWTMPPIGSKRPQDKRPQDNSLHEDRKTLNEDYFAVFDSHLEKGLAKLVQTW